MARPRTPSSTRGRAILLGGLLLFVIASPGLPSPGEATAQAPSSPSIAPSPPPAAAPPAPSSARESAPAAIPVAEVATRATGVTNLLRELTTQLAPSPTSEAIRKGIPTLREAIDRDLETIRVTLEGQPSLDVLQAQQQLWQRRQVEATGWLTALTHRATLLQGAMNQLAELRKTWHLTGESAKASKAPAPILTQIETVLAEIEGTEKPLTAHRTAVLDLQSVVAQEVARSGAALAQFTQAQQRAMGGILTRDSPPLWDPATWGDVPTVLPARVRHAVGVGGMNLVHYARDPQGLPLHVGIIALWR